MQYHDIVSEHEVLERVIEIKPDPPEPDNDTPDEDTTDDHGNDMCGTYAVDSVGRVWKFQKGMTGIFRALRLDKPRGEAEPTEKKESRKRANS